MGFGLVYHLINFAHKKRWTRVFTKAFDKIQQLFGFKKVRSKKTMLSKCISYLKKP